MAEEKTMPIDFAPGLTCYMRAPKEEQLAVVYTTMRAAERDPANYARALEMFFRMIERLLVDKDDAMRIDEALMDEKITFKQLADALESLVGGLSGKPTAKAPAKRVRTTRR
jgi:hypothetical protein